MIVLHTKTLKDGRRHMLVVMAANEKGELLLIKQDKFYKLGYPVDDTIVQSHHVAGATEVYWDSYSQKWSEA